MRIADVLTDFVGARPQPLQIGPAQKLVFHAPPDLRIERVQSVQPAFHLLDELKLLARAFECRLQFRDGLRHALRDAIGLVEDTELLQHRVDPLLDGRCLD